METRHGIADYEFLGVIGAGAGSCYYRARGPERIASEQELVAVKVLTHCNSTDAFRRITRELRLFASVPSPYLVRLFDAGRDGDAFYYAMEYFADGSLGTPAARPSRAVAQRSVSDAARAAHALHEAGVAHRGIKPSNVLLAEDGGGRLSDLGVAQILAPGQTVTGLPTLGPLEYTDPRILAGDDASRASDVWSLGATLHRALSGTGLYAGPSGLTPAVQLRTVLGQEARVAPGLDPAAASLIRACIDPDPSLRPDSALEVAERIDELG